MPTLRYNDTAIRFFLPPFFFFPPRIVSLDLLLNVVIYLPFSRFLIADRRVSPISIFKLEKFKQVRATKKYQERNLKF